MTNKINLMSLLLSFLLISVSLNAQTPHFYYYKGEKLHLELDTKHQFPHFQTQGQDKIALSNYFYVKTFFKELLKTIVFSKIFSKLQYYY